MKIQCEVCEKVEAEVLCCADEAVLCRRCDHNVHAANKLSLKHERLLLLKSNPSSTSSSSSLTSSSPSHAQLPPCHICQERNGYFFCLEDRALFCKHCDVSTHMGSPSASSHQRFLITGVKVALQASINNNDMISTNSSSPKSTSTSFNFVADKESSTAAMTMNVEAASTESRASFSAEPNFGWLLNEMFDTLQASINNNDMISTNSSSPKSTSTSFNFVADKESSTAAMTMNVEAASTESRASFSAEPNFGWLLNEMFDTKDLNCYEFSEVGSSRITSTTP